MPSWFKKVFKNDTPPRESVAPPPGPTVNEVRPVFQAPSLDRPALGQPDSAAFEESAQKQRTVVQAPVLMPDEERSHLSEEIRIKAEVERDRASCRFMVDRPVLEGLSASFPESRWAKDISGLAETLFSVKGVNSVLLHDMTVTVTSELYDLNEWEKLAEEIGSLIREYLKAEKPVVSDAFRDAMPTEDVIRERVQTCVDMEINPGIASHSGVVTVERVVGNTVYITMGGGCQGCAASAITLRQGIHGAFRRAVPQIGAIYDETDHTAGTNPYFSELPAGMS